MRKSASCFILSGLIVLITFCSGQGFLASAEEKLSSLHFELTSTTISGGMAAWNFPSIAAPFDESPFAFPVGDAGLSANYISVVPEPTAMSLSVLATIVSLAFRKRSGSRQ